jgi:hypothetical protein
VSAAIRAARSGQTIVLRAGTYHESVAIPAGKRLTLQAYPGEAVWFDGTVPVTSWRRSGSTWTATGWTAEFDSTSSFSRGRNNPSFINRQFPMAAHPDQVFVDGVQLRQVASARQVTPGTFAVDARANTLTIGTDPNGRAVRASALERAIVVSGAGSVLQGFGVRGYATPVPQMGAVVVAADGAVVRDLVVRDNATTGISTYRAGVRLERVTVTASGLTGIHGNQADGLVIQDAVVSGNNSERFNPAPSAAGIKVTRTRGLTIRNTESSNNFSRGIWADESVYDMTFVGNRTIGNTEAGIEIEISDTAVVADNVSTGNKIGVLIFSSGNIKVYNNYVGGNSFMAIQVVQDRRRQSNRAHIGRDPRAPVPDPTMPWLVRNIEIVNNVFGSQGLFQFYALDKETRIPADRMNIRLDGNLFAAKVAGRDPTMVAWGGSNNVQLSRYQTPQDLARAKNPKWRNATARAGLTQESMLAEARRSDVAVPLPRDVAQAVGQPAGVRRVGPF